VYTARVSEERRGVLLGAAAYLMWGVLPLYWPLFRPASAIEILAHRVVWSLGTVALLLARARNLGAVLRIGARRARLLAMAAVFIAVNWGVYIWAVNHQHVVETALGYFVNPLVTVMLGVFVLGERLRRMQWIAIAIAAVAVTVLAIDYGRLPWIAIALAFSFALYGLLKKKAGVGALESLALETAVLAAPAALYLATREVRGVATFGHVSWKLNLLLMSSGAVTTIPLLCFAAAANRVPLSTIGALQYIAPILQFLSGVFVLHEAMPASRWAGFVLVWVALVVFVFDGVLARSRRGAPAAGLPAESAKG
jgi:chloramphenicol-sensitive protein RarD